jgi:hypothetical protein
LASDSDADDEPFWVFWLDGFVFTGRIGVKEEPSVPHTRLAYIHLHASSSNDRIGRCFEA